MTDNDTRRYYCYTFLFLFDSHGRSRYFLQTCAAASSSSVEHPLVPLHARAGRK